MSDRPFSSTSCEWSETAIELDGLPAWLQRNISLDPEQWSGFDHLVSVPIAFDKADEEGRPASHELRDEIAAVTEQCRQHFEAEGKSVMALVLTHAGVQTLYFYTSDPERAIELWERELAPAPETVQVDFCVQPDENWETWRNCV